MNAFIRHTSLLLQHYWKNRSPYKLLSVRYDVWRGGKNWLKRCNYPGGRTITKEFCQLRCTILSIARRLPPAAVLLAFKAFFFEIKLWSNDWYNYLNRQHVLSAHWHRYLKTKSPFFWVIFHSATRCLRNRCILEGVLRQYAPSVREGYSPHAQHWSV